MHSKIWNALSAFRIRSRTTTAAAPAARVESGSLRASPGARRHYDTRRAARQLDHCLSTGVDVYRHVSVGLDA